MKSCPQTLQPPQSTMNEVQLLPESLASITANGPNLTILFLFRKFYGIFSCLLPLCSIQIWERAFAALHFGWNLAIWFPPVGAIVRPETMAEPN